MLAGVRQYRRWIDESFLPEVWGLLRQGLSCLTFLIPLAGRPLFLVEVLAVPAGSHGARLGATQNTIKPFLDRNA